MTVWLILYSALVVKTHLSYYKCYQPITASLIRLPILGNAGRGNVYVTTTTSTTLHAFNDTNSVKH